MKVGHLAETQFAFPTFTEAVSMAAHEPSTARTPDLVIVLIVPGRERNERGLPS